MSATRRELLAVTAATVTLPMLQSALNSMRSASAAPQGPKNKEKPVAETPGFFATTLKPADLKENEFTLVEGHAILLARKGNTVTAFSNKCTHKGCSLKPQAGKDSITCKCHQANFTLEGIPTKVAKEPLPIFAIKTDDKGHIEIDPGQKVAKGDSNASISV